MQNMERLQYAAALYLNMGYYTIRLLPAIHYMTEIVTELGKFKYNHLPMGMCSSGDIFQDKVDELLGDIKGIKTYMKYILVFIKEILSKHI